MSRIAVFYGSTTGTCEELAAKVAEKLGTDQVFNVTELDDARLGEYDILVLGTSTWGDGELQDDWYDGVKVLERNDLTGKKVALFGCGDSACYPDTFCNAMGTLYHACHGATIIGKGLSTDGYSFAASEAVENGTWVGCALDEMNEGNMTENRLDAWVALLKSQL